MRIYRLAYIDKAGYLMSKWCGSLSVGRSEWAKLEADPARRAVDIEAVDIPTRTRESLAEWLNQDHTYRAESWV